MSRTLALLAPAMTCVPPVFPHAQVNAAEHKLRLEQLQRLRGSIYVEDGAIESWQLTADGRHVTSADEESWHLLSMQADETVGCARLQVYSPTVPYQVLGVAESALAKSDEWGEALKLCITSELQTAQFENLRFVEAGGWALAHELRFTTEALNIALGSYAIGCLLGGSLGLSTATVRHQSAPILKRLGGTCFTWQGQDFPPYYDPQYQCEMELVRFDSRFPNPKYRSIVHKLQADLLRLPVICRTEKLAGFGEPPSDGSLTQRQLLRFPEVEFRKDEQVSL